MKIKHTVVFAQLLKTLSMIFATHTDIAERPSRHLPVYRGRSHYAGAELRIAFSFFFFVADASYFLRT